MDFPPSGFTISLKISQCCNDIPLKNRISFDKIRFNDPAQLHRISRVHKPRTDAVKKPIRINRGDIGSAAAADDHNGALLLSTL
jgi:hypothetical protein